MYKPQYPKKLRGLKPTGLKGIAVDRQLRKIVEPNLRCIRPKKEI